MYYKKESQFTNNASKRVFEEVYTNEDMSDDKAKDNHGYYTLRTPPMFAANLSQEKAISPRRVMCEPKAHSFTTRIRYYAPGHADDDDYIGESPYVSFDFTSENTFVECLNHMRDKLTLVKDQTIYSIDYEYNKLEGTLFLYACANRLRGILFRFECQDYDNYKELWHLFNQITPPFNTDELDLNLYDEDLLQPTKDLILGNVWNRDPLYVHASFSSSKKHYLCRTGDFWFKPSKYYYDNITNDEFIIFFTTDGTHYIIPHDAVKIIELCFILKQFARL